MVRGKLMKSAAAVILLACAGFGMALGGGWDRTDAPERVSGPPGATEPNATAARENVAWGREVGGLQLGLAGVAGEYRQGEKMQARVRLRNVGKAEVKITFGLLKEYAPAVTAANGVRMTVAMPPSPEKFVPPPDRVIKPGETIGLSDPVVAVESDDALRDDALRLKGLIRVDTPTTYLAPGKYRIAFGGMIQSHPTLATGAVEFEVRAPADPQDKVKSPPKERAEAFDPFSAKRVEELQKERIATLKELVEQLAAHFQSARVSYDEVLDAQMLLLRAELDIAEKESDRIALYKKTIEALKESEKVANAQVQAGRGAGATVLKIKARRLEVEIELEKTMPKETKKGK